MKVSVFGATGFMGYDFMRHAMSAGREFELTAYTTSACSLTNLSRHEVDIRLTSYADLPTLELESGTELIVNFAHPFAVREVLSTKQQSKRLAQFLRRQLESRRDMRLIHISSMSVYEPFAAGHEFDEDSTIKPPADDSYACDKATIDRQILNGDLVSNHVLILRPTVVYGPMGRPWTDNIFKEFLKGDVLHFGLNGRIQPIWVSDASRFIIERMRRFVPGILNLAGPDTLTWKEFLSWFEAIAENGRLREIPSTIEADEKQRRSTHARAMSRLRGLVHHPSLKEFVRPLWQRMPQSLRAAAKRKLEGPERTSRGPYRRKFFEEDRLVSIGKLKSEFPDYALTPMEATIPTLKSYFQFRFKDGPFW